MVFSSARRINRVSDTRLLLRRFRAAHMALIFAWLAFWINAAILPCCEAFAATSDDHADAGAQSVSVSAQTHGSSNSHREHPQQDPDSRCGHTINAEPAINSEYAGVPTSRVHLQWDAMTVNVAAVTATATQSAKLAMYDYHPPPPHGNFRLYLQTLRLLI